jgi:hypothetical protein
VPINPLKRLASRVGLAKPLTFAEWLEANPEPDPHALALRFGGFSKVPVAQWTRLDRAIAVWRKARRPFMLRVLATGEITIGVDCGGLNRRRIAS